MRENRFDDFSLLQLAEVAEEYVWGQIKLSDDDREHLRLKLLDRFEQVEALNRATATPAPPEDQIL